jgi:DNA-directed RNA polymerase specialized sigma24 family protein
MSLSRDDAVKKFSNWERMRNWMRSYLGKVVWRDTAMTNPAAPIDALTADLRSRSAGKDGRLAMERFARAGIDAGGAGSPIELAELCARLEDRDFSEKVVAGLAGLPPGDELAGLTVLVALRPALIRIAHRLVGLGVPAEEVQADVIAAAWEGVRSSAGLPGASPAGKVVAATWNRCRAGSRRAWQQRLTERALPATLTVAEPGMDPAEQVSTLVYEARCHGVLSRAQAALVYDTRILGRPIEEVAASLGRSPNALRKQRERIEAALRAFVVRTEGEVA